MIPHGGPHSRTTFVLNLGWQLLAANGYVVLAPNFRGSVGYGQAFIDADRADFGGGDFRDLLRGVTTQFVRYPNEGHAISQPQHVRDYWERVLEWFGKYLR